MKKLALGLAIFSSVVFGISLRGMGKDNTGCGTFGACLSETLPSGGGNGGGGGSGGGSGGGGTINYPSNFLVFEEGFTYVGDSSILKIKSDNIVVRDDISINQVDFSPYMSDHYLITSVAECKYPYVLRVKDTNIEIYNLSAQKVEKQIAGTWRDRDGKLVYCPTFESNKIFGLRYSSGSSFRKYIADVSVFSLIAGNASGSSQYSIGRRGFPVVAEGKALGLNSNLDKCVIYFFPLEVSWSRCGRFGCRHYLKYTTYIAQLCSNRQEKYYSLTDKGYPLFLKKLSNGKWYLYTLSLSGTNNYTILRGELTYNSNKDQLELINIERMINEDGVSPYGFSNIPYSVCLFRVCYSADSNTGDIKKVDVLDWKGNYSPVSSYANANGYCEYEHNSTDYRGNTLRKVYLYVGKTFAGNCPNLRVWGFLDKGMSFFVKPDFSKGNIEKMYGLVSIYLSNVTPSGSAIGFAEIRKVQDGNAWGIGVYDLYIYSFIDGSWTIKKAGFWSKDTFVWGIRKDDRRRGYIFWSNPDFANFYQKNVIK